MTKKAGKIFTGIFIFLIYLGIFLIFSFWQEPILYLEKLTGNNTLLAPFIFSFLAFVAVVIAPITILPILPLASNLFGSFWAGTYLLVGWLIGSMTAFYLARHFGKPLLKRMISLESIEKYEDKIPKEMEFWWIFLVRFVVQIDVLSYAFGLFSRVSIWKFISATVLAFAPSAYLASYAGQAFFTKEFENLAVLILIFTILFIIFSFFLYRKNKNKEKTLI